MQSPKDIKKGQRGARPHYKLEPFYSSSCRSAQPVSEQTETNDLYAYQAPSTIPRRNSSNSNSNSLSHSEDLNHSNFHVISDSSSIIKTTNDVEHFKGVNQQQRPIAFISSHNQDGNFATNSKLSGVHSPPDFVGAASCSPLRSNESPQNVLLKPNDIKTEQQFMQFNHGEGSTPQIPAYPNSIHLNWTKVIVQDEPEDLSMGTRQRTSDTDTISYSTTVDNAWNKQDFIFKASRKDMFTSWVWTKISNICLIYSYNARTLILKNQAWKIIIILCLMVTNQHTSRN